MILIFGMMPVQKQRFGKCCEYHKIEQEFLIMKNKLSCLKRKGRYVERNAKEININR